MQVENKIDEINQGFIDIIDGLDKILKAHLLFKNNKEIMPVDYVELTDRIAIFANLIVKSKLPQIINDTLEKQNAN